MEDEYLVLTPEDFGMEFYVDADNDVFSNIQIVSVSDEINLGYVRNDVEHRVLICIIWGRYRFS